jgi:hypothetical protein
VSYSPHLAARLIVIVRSKNMQRYNSQAIAQIEHGGFWIRSLATVLDLAVRMGLACR